MALPFGEDTIRDSDAANRERPDLWMALFSGSVQSVTYIVNVLLQAATIAQRLAIQLRAQLRWLSIESVTA
jgi:hypothetical protein